MVMLIYIDLLFQPFGDRLDLPTYQGFPDSSVKNPPVTQETLVRFLGSEDPLEKGKATHSSIWPGEFHGLYSAAAAAAVAKSLQSFPTLCHPLDSSP